MSDNFWPGPETFDVEVVGESHYQSNLRKIAGPQSEEGVRVECTAILVLEVGNPHDANAVRVDIGTLTVGYLKRTEAPAVRQALAGAGIASGGAVEVAALIVGGRNDQNYGVWLDIPTVRAAAVPTKRPWWRFW
jgi:hypothetical protein